MSEPTSTVTVTVSGMTCGHCVSSVREEIGGIPGVTAVDVDLASGRVTIASEGAVDPSTGSIMIEVGFPNPEKIILPGQFGRVRITAGQNRNAILVPQAAVLDLQGNSMAYAFDPKTNTVSVRNLKLGQRFGNSWIVESGLKPGEQVVVEGLQKLKDGQPVTPRPAQPASGN